jgi:hypothetical protein
LGTTSGRTAERVARAGIEIRVKGAVSAAESDCLHGMISAVLAKHARAVDLAQVRITGSAYEGGPAVVQVSVRVCGAPARVQVPGQTPVAAIAAAAARLDRQIRRLTTEWAPWPWPDPERHPLNNPGLGSIARMKSTRLHVGMHCQAAAVLHAMDYDVFLYVDAETGEDAIVYRAGPTGLRLARQNSMRPPAMPSTLPLTINPRRVPTMTTREAALQLAKGWLPFVFYTDHDTRRGHLLYRRYDRQLGLITPGEVAPDLAGDEPRLWPAASRPIGAWVRPTRPA